jgi:pantoate--beta-alanine ligase
MTQVIYALSEWQALRSQLKGSLGFVPTLGNLHEGHESLLKRSAQENQYTVLSIFLNPTQFDEAKDLENYPQTLQRDIEIAKKQGADWVLVPSLEAIYPDKYHYRVTETDLSHRFCGQRRPGHFDGVLTVVLKLLQLVKATRAYFGEKDFQQLELVRGMVQAFFLEVEMVACPTVRDSNGLALSSRNSRLTPAEYQLALQFPKLLASSQPLAAIREQLSLLGFLVAYIEEYNGRRLGAVKIGEVWLIDNVLLPP